MFLVGSWQVSGRFLAGSWQVPRSVPRRFLVGFWSVPDRLLVGQVPDRLLVGSWAGSWSSWVSGTFLKGSC